MRNAFAHFDARVIADSINSYGNRLVTMELMYPRMVHPEMLTHRQFSRNTASSRAIPSANLIKLVRENPAAPIHWGKNQSGMQAFEELGFPEMDLTKQAWYEAAEMAAFQAEKMLKQGAHKQIVNRVLEPFLPIRCVITATEWSNFYALRRHKDAQPEIQHLAELAAAARNNSEPNLLLPGEWHLPYVDELDKDQMGLEDLIKVSVARCARLSYRLHDGTRSTIDKDVELYNRLLASRPLHASPAEHQATPDELRFGGLFGWWWKNRKLHGNLIGWNQYRKSLPDECM